MAFASDRVPYITQSLKLSADMQQPSALAVDQQSQVYILDGLNQRVVIFDDSGRKIKSVALSLSGNDSHTAPMDMVIDKATWLIADPDQHRILRFSPQGKLLEKIVLEGLHRPTLKLPEPIALSLDEDVLYWSDRANHQICRQSLKEKGLANCFGQYGESSGQFRFPYQMAMDRDGYIHAIDVLNGRVQMFNSRGRYFSSISRFGVETGDLFRPNGIAFDDNDFMYVSDSYLGYISIFKSGRFIDYLRDKDNQTVRYQMPVYLKISNKNLLIVDSLDNSIQKLNLAYKALQKTTTKRKLKPLSSQKNCISCHVSWADSSITDSVDNSVLPVASEKMCYSCHHGVVVESRRAMMHQYQHPSIYQKSLLNPDAKLTEKDDKVPTGFPLNQDKKLLCSSCHTPHNSDENQEVLYDDHSNAWLRVSNRSGDLCERCHQSKSIGAREKQDHDSSVSNHPLGIHFGTEKEYQGLAVVAEHYLEKGLPKLLQINGGMLDQQQALICQTCHQIHAGKDKALLVLSNQDNQLCNSCHQSKTADDKKSARKKGIHPVNIVLDKPINHQGQSISEIKCESCHQVHNGAADSPLFKENLTAQEDQLCFICHKKKYSKNPEQAHRKGIHPANFRLTEPRLRNGKKINEVSCYSCHSLHSGVPNSSLLVTQKNKSKIADTELALCVSCHQEQYAKDKQQARAKGIHPVDIKLEKPIKVGKIKIEHLTCASCHRVHNGQVNSAQLWDGDKNINKVEALCAACHQGQYAKSKQEAIDKGIHPLNLELEQAVQINNKEVKVVTCLSCHSVHQGKKNTAVLHEDIENGELCKNCHKQQQRVINTDHDLRKTAPKSKNHFGQSPQQAGLCGSCHSMHQSNKVKNNLPKLSSLKIRHQHNPDMEKVLFQRDQLCINCHQPDSIGKEKVVNHFSHPHRDLILRSDPKHMPLLNKDESGSGKESIDEFGSIACITCHDPHIWDTEKKLEIESNKNRDGNSNNSFLRQKDVKESFCISCHGIESRLKYKYYHDKKHSRNLGIKYIK